MFAAWHVSCSVHPCCGVPGSPHSGLSQLRCLPPSCTSWPSGGSIGAPPALSTCGALPVASVARCFLPPVSCSAWPGVVGPTSHRLATDPLPSASDFLLPELAGMQRLEVLQVQPLWRSSLVAACLPQVIVSAASCCRYACCRCYCCCVTALPSYPMMAAAPSQRADGSHARGLVSSRLLPKAQQVREGSRAMGEAVASDL